MTAETIIQSLASGLLMGLLYGLIAAGLALIFGLMDVVNFAHGEFLMIAMYATFFLFAFFAIDPLLAAPLVAAALFVFGAVVYLLVVRFAMRAKANAGMVQIFSTFGLAIVMRGLAQFFFTPDYRSVTNSWVGGKTISIAGIYLPEPQLIGAMLSIAAFVALYFFINRTDFGRALEAGCRYGRDQWTRCRSPLKTALPLPAGRTGNPEITGSPRPPGRPVARSSRPLRRSLASPGSGPAR